MAAAGKVRLFGITKKFWALIFPLTGFGIGAYLDGLETERLVKFRDRSALFGGMVKPGDPPPWP